MISYEQWNKAIIKHIFENCEPDEIVFLNTTRETLDTIAEQEGFNVDAVESLMEAVKDKVVISNEWVRLRQIYPRGLSDNTFEEEPPHVVCLLRV